MNFKLNRHAAHLYGIFGTLVSEDDNHAFVTLEHAFATVDPKTFVPKLATGIYTATRYYSPKHGRDVFFIEGVPNFQGMPVRFIEMHIGCVNNDSDGCVLLGMKFGTNMVEDSRVAFEQFMDLQKDVLSFTVTIT